MSNCRDNLDTDTDFDINSESESNDNYQELSSSIIRLKMNNIMPYYDDVKKYEVEAEGIHSRIKYAAILEIALCAVSANCDGVLGSLCFLAMLGNTAYLGYEIIQSGLNHIDKEAARSNLISSSFHSLFTNNNEVKVRELFEYAALPLSHSRR